MSVLRTTYNIQYTLENANDGAARDPRQFEVEIRQQRPHVGCFQLSVRFAGMGVEIAIWALPEAPGKVYVQRQGDRDP